MKANQFIHDERGIVTIIGLVMFIILTIMIALFSPILVEALGIAKENFTDTISLLLLDAWPAFLLIGIAAGYFIYASAGSAR